jgi:TRAP-type C4-dicarboxylate transport system permease small subunit
VYIGFLGASIGVHKKTHLGVAVFKEMSPKPVQRLFEFSSHVIMGGFGLVMTIYGYKLTVFKWAHQIPLIHVSEGLRALPIMLSGIFIFLFSIGHLIHFFQGTNQEEAE